MRGDVWSDSFDQSLSHSAMIVEPNHFQSLFLIMGFIMSLGLIDLLWDILANPSFNFLYLMLTGFSACLLITCTNLFFFSTALWTPITLETEERKDKLGNIASSAKIIATGDFEINMEILVTNKTVALAIIGYGAVVSFIFIFVAMMRSLGNTFPNDNYFIVGLIQGCLIIILLRKSQLRKKRVMNNI